MNHGQHHVSLHTLQPAKVKHGAGIFIPLAMFKPWYSVMAKQDLTVASMTKLAKIANESASKAERSAIDAVREAVVCGEALNAAKEKCPHGDWISWLESNFDYSRQTAAKYMKLANVNHGLHLDDFKSMRQALIAVSESEPKKEQKEAKPSESEVIDAEFELIEEQVQESMECEVPESDAPPHTPTPPQVRSSSASVVKDSLERDVPETLRDKFSVAARLSAVGRKLDGIKREVSELATEDGGWFLPVQDIELSCKDLKDKITDAGYWTACPRCDGKGCKRCDSSGFIPKSKKNMLSKADQEELGL